MKINANEIKPGMIIEHKNDYWNVLKTQHVKPGKGGAFNQVELKSLLKVIKTKKLILHISKNQALKNLDRMFLVSMHHDMKLLKHAHIGNKIICI